MQAGVGLLVSDVMPIYMIIPRYSHNYAQFCQLLNSNLFTHRRILMPSREASSETYGPGVYLYHIVLLLLCYLLCLYFTLHLYHKNTKNIIFIISIWSHSRKWPYRDWQPLFALVARIYLFCAGTRDSRVASYWIDTLVLKNWGKYLHYFVASSLPLRAKPTQCSRGSKKDFWRRCREGLRKSQHTKYPSHTLISRITLFAICLSFSSTPLHPCRFIRPLFPTLLLSFACPFFCSLGWIRCLFIAKQRT